MRFLAFFFLLRRCLPPSVCHKKLCCVASVFFFFWGGGGGESEDMCGIIMTIIVEIWESMPDNLKSEKKVGAVKKLTEVWCNPKVVFLSKGIRAPKL